MPIPNGDLMLCHLMMLQEVRDVVAVRTGRFQFEVVEYGETKFCLISGLRFGPYVDVINTKCNKKYVLRNQLFPNVRDEDLRLKDIEDYIKGPKFLTCGDVDADNVGSSKTCKYMVTGFQLPYAHHTANEFPRMKAWRIKTQLTVEQYLRILDVSLENNIPRAVDATNFEI
uniref:Uncharacterized protein n=1 Tax=Lactuca sativa TaxID=4236 RepID=A0A9R1XIS3_LACSA|nr:hypothetical protein LSAT_V11C300107060 [Lactuca sativa]